MRNMLLRGVTHGVRQVGQSPERDVMFATACLAFTKDRPGTSWRDDDGKTQHVRTTTRPVDCLACLAETSQTKRG